MGTPIGAAQKVARGVAGILWLAGTAILIQSELAHASVDWVAVAIVPVVWGAVITLPILSSYAFKDRQAFAGCILALAAVVGTGYTLSGTISRQAESRDVTVSTVEADQKRSARVGKLLKSAEDMLAGAQKKHLAACRGRRASRCEAIQSTIGIYEGAVAGHKHTLSQIKTRSPLAGEQRIARALASLPKVTMSAEEIAPVVATWLPSLLGILIELGALGSAMYGWHARSVPAVVSVATTSTVSDVPPSGHREYETKEDQIISFAREFEARHGRTPRHKEVVEAGFPKATASRALNRVAG